jgi:micrococcal nuclease
MYEYKAKVTDVHDGDTFKATVDLGFSTYAEQTFRMQGINAPELKGNTMQAGIVSRDKLRELIMGKDIIIKSFKPKTSLKQEKYGRYLARVYLENEQNKTFFFDVNTEMIGGAVAYMV